MTTVLNDTRNDPKVAAHRARSWTPVCALVDIPRLGARRVRRAAGADVAVFRAADDHVVALLDRCPHRGGPLSQGIVFGHSVACPLHNWTIELADGQARAPDVGCTQAFTVNVEAGTVYLDRVELDSLGLEPATVAPAGA
ncbi:MAG: nitrite reductase small subunit NirD [Caldimonas sp.]